jgi:hypothetical protein
MRRQQVCRLAGVPMVERPRAVAADEDSSAAEEIAVLLR